METSVILIVVFSFIVLLLTVLVFVYMDDRIQRIEKYLKLDKSND